MKFKNLDIFIQRMITFIIVIGIPLGVTSILIYLVGLDPLQVYKRLFLGGFGGLTELAQSLSRANPLLLCGLGLTLAFRCGLWNIGAEGQLYIGALLAVIAGLFIKGIPMVFHLPLMFAAGFFGGAIWALAPAILKVKYKTNILIITLLMNFVATWLVYYAVRFPLKSEKSFNPITDFIPYSARLPRVLPGTNLHVGVFVSMAIVIVVWLILEKTILGYRINALGANLDAAQYSGIPTKKIIVTTMFLSGGLSGLAGMGEVSGVNYILHQEISAHFGYLAIAIAFIGRLIPGWVFVASILFGGLMIGARHAQATLGLPRMVVDVFLALWMLSILLLPVIKKGTAFIVKNKNGSKGVK